MSQKLVWDETGKKLYETGVSNLAIYPMGANGTYGDGIAWNGVTSIAENPGGGEANALYADNIKYLDLMSAETFGLTLSAYTYPDEFEECDGTAELKQGVNVYQQKRKPFGMAYKTLIGNDTDDTDHGYKIHIIYNCRAKPSSKTYSTVNASAEAITFSWEVTTTPVPVTGHKPTAVVTVDSSKVGTGVMEKLEEVLFGTETSAPRILLPDEIVTLVDSVA